MENKTLDESIISALDGTDTRLVKYIPYILQDFWEIGTPPEDIIEIIQNFKQNYSNLELLDLGSGKGAVSINAALELKCKCFGIDGINDFVIYSQNKAKELSVENLCTFETGDIRIKLKTLGKYDVIVLGAIGPVFGNYYETLTQLKPHLKDDGIIIINDAYAEDDCENSYPGILQRSDLIKQTKDVQMEIIDVIIDDDTELTGEFKIELDNLTKRCLELAEQYPKDKDLFLKYIEKQKKEYEILSNEIIPAIFVLKEK